VRLCARAYVVHFCALHALEETPSLPPLLPRKTALDVIFADPRPLPFSLIPVVKPASVADPQELALAVAVPTNRGKQD